MQDRTSPFLKGGRGSTDVATYYYRLGHEAGYDRHASFGGEDYDTNVFNVGTRQHAGCVLSSAASTSPRQIPTAPPILQDGGR
jgi:hypothetical protein